MKKIWDGAINIGQKTWTACKNNPKTTLVTGLAVTHEINEYTTASSF